MPLPETAREAQGGGLAPGTVPACCPPPPSEDSDSASMVDLFAHFWHLLSTSAPRANNLVTIQPLPQGGKEVMLNSCQDATAWEAGCGTGGHS